MCLFTQLGWQLTGSNTATNAKTLGVLAILRNRRIAQKDAALTSSSPILLLFIIIFQVEVTVRSHDRVEVS